MRSEIDEYLKQKSLVLRPSSLQRLASQLEEFARCVELEHWSELSSRHLLEYLNHKKSHCKAITVANIYGKVMGFVDFLYARSYFLSHPLKRRPKSLPDYLPRFTPSIELANEIFNSSLGQKYPLRNRAILELVYGSGLRRAEVRVLNVNDVLGEALHIIGKRGKERMVPIGDRAREAVLAYLFKERPLLLERVKKQKEISLRADAEKALFIGEMGRRLSPNTYTQVIVPKHIHKGLTLHSFRHACASHMLENGASSVHLKELLGHAKLSTTQIYTRVSDKHLKETLEKFHPRG